MFARRAFLSLTALYWVALFVVTHLPPARMMHGPSNDKLQHFLAYFVLAIVLGVTLLAVMPARRRVVPLLTLAVAAAYGVFDELTQIPVGRSAEVGDWVADVSGAAAAAVVLFVLQALMSRGSRADVAADGSLAV